MASHATDDEIIRLFFQVAKLSQYISEADGESAMLYIGQYRCMLYLQQHSPISQKQLAQALQIRPASLSELLSKLQRKNLIQRTLSPTDSRSRLVCLTPLGLREVQEYERKSQRLHSAMLSRVSSEEKEQFYHILLKIQHYKDEATPYGNDQ